MSVFKMRMLLVMIVMRQETITGIFGVRLGCGPVARTIQDCFLQSLLFCKVVKTWV